MQSKFLVATVFASVSLGIASWKIWQSWERDRNDDTAFQGRAGRKAQGNPVVGVMEAGLIRSWKEEGFTQAWTAEDFRDVQIVDRTQQPDGSWEEDVYLESTAYNIHTMNSGGKDLFCIAGAVGMEFQLECWRLKRRKIGIPGQNLPPKRIEKTEIFRGPLELPVQSLAIDPERRFVIVLAGQGPSRTLYRFSLASSGPPVILQTGIDLPALQGVKHVDRLQHVSFGRVWLLQGFAQEIVASTFVVYTDTDNDGVFDPPIVDTLSGMIARGFIGENAYWDEFDGLKD